MRLLVYSDIVGALFFWLCATAFWCLLFCLKSSWNQEEVPGGPGPSQPLLDKNKS